MPLWLETSDGKNDISDNSTGGMEVMVLMATLECGKIIRIKQKTLHCSRMQKKQMGVKKC